VNVYVCVCKLCIYMCVYVCVRVVVVVVDPINDMSGVDGVGMCGRS
jgi:hypothetical protein